MYSVEFHVAVFDEACLAEGDGDDGCQDCGKDEADQEKTDPVACGDGCLGAFRDVIDPACVDADLADQSAGTHAGGNGGAVHLHFENAGGDGTGDRRGDDRGEPDHRVADNVAHLQHGGADTLGDKPAPFILLKGHEGKADHLCAATCDSGASGKPCKGQSSADGCGRNGQSESDSDDDRDKDAHDEGLLIGRPHDEGTDAGSSCADGRSDQGGKSYTGEDRHKGCDQDVHSGLLGDDLAELGCDDRDDENGKRAACLTHLICRGTDCYQREKHKRRSLQGEADGDGHCCAAHGRGVSADFYQRFNSQLCAQCIQDRSDQERREETLRHGAERVDSVAARRNNDILACEEALFFFSHFFNSFSFRVC